MNEYFLKPLYVCLFYYYGKGTFGRTVLLPLSFLFLNGCLYRVQAVIYVVTSGSCNCTSLLGLQRTYTCLHTSVVRRFG